MTTDKWKTRLAQEADEDKAKILSRFFKTAPGEYGEGDIFIGVTVPKVRAVAREFIQASPADIHNMLQSPVHEHRLSALLTLVEQYREARRDTPRRKTIVNFYLAHSTRANNWDLVDLSAPKILGEWLTVNHDPELLDRLSLSDNLWQQRIAIVATLTLIRHGLYSDTLRLARRYLTHPHPLMHKATGWMLREVGKRDLPTLLAFLDAHAHTMPRTALRYAIERLTPDQRRHYMSQKSAHAATAKNKPPKTPADEKFF